MINEKKKIEVYIYWANDVYHFCGEHQEEETEQVEGVRFPHVHRWTDWSHVTKNGQYYLSWHHAAALTANGIIENSWLQGKSDQDVIKLFCELESLSFEDSISHINKVCNTFVY